MDLVDRLLEHDRWATMEVLAACAPLPDAELDQPFDIGLQTLRRTLDHMVFNVGFWTWLMAGRPVESAPEERPGSSLQELSDRHEQSYDAFAALSRRLRDGQRLDDTYLDHYDVRKSFGSTIIHVAMHNAEHRTEAIHILNRLGLAEVPEVDHGLWDYLQLNT